MTLELSDEDWGLLDELYWQDPGASEGRFYLVDNAAGEDRRWHRKMQMIFRVQGDLSLWAADWELGLTEMQEGYTPSEIRNVYRVKPVPTTIIVYESDQ